MITDIENKCIEAIKNNNFNEVYGFYDNIDIRSKSEEAFIVLSLNKLEAGTVIPGESIYYNFTAQLGVNIYASKNSTPEKLYSIMQNTVIPSIANTYRIAGFDIYPLEFNTSMRRFKMYADFRLRGTYNLNLI